MARPMIPGAPFAAALSAVGALCLLSPFALISQVGPESPFGLVRAAPPEDRTIVGHSCSGLFASFALPRALSNGLRFVFGSP